ncbi:MAG: lipid-A-disaccharide synthase [Candidatus Omnitrophota bacterium]
MKKIVIIAGDKSGDLYGGMLARNVRQKMPSIEITSFGGPHLAEQTHQAINLLTHSVSGLVEVIRHLGNIFKIFKQTVKEIDRIKPDLVIPIDFPDFNLRLAKTLNNRYPLYYYISPQVWAWRKGRIELIRRYVKEMVVIFTFEEEFYKKEGIVARYFGHPLLEIIPQKKFSKKNVISLLPGSRENEIKRHLPVMLEAVPLIRARLPGYTFRIIRPLNIPLEYYARFNPSIAVIEHSYEAIGESAFIITSSGTATVEIALLEVPFVILYKVNALTWSILRRMVKTDFIGMVNILAKKKIIEEFLQDTATSEALAHTAVATLSDTHTYAAVKKELANLRETIGSAHATERFADFIVSRLG